MQFGDRLSAHPGHDIERRSGHDTTLDEAIAQILVHMTVYGRFAAASPRVLAAFFTVQNYAEFGRMETVAPGSFDTFVRERARGNIPPVKRSYGNVARVGDLVLGPPVREAT